MTYEHRNQILLDQVDHQDLKLMVDFPGYNQVFERVFPVEVYKNHLDGLVDQALQ